MNQRSSSHRRLHGWWLPTQTLAITFLAFLSCGVASAFSVRGSAIFGKQSPSFFDDVGRRLEFRSINKPQLHSAVHTDTHPLNNGCFLNKEPFTEQSDTECCTRKTRGPVLTPYHIIHPSYSYQEESAPSPLSVAMTMTIKALQRIVNDEDFARNLLDTVSLEGGEEGVATVVRIEHAISQDIDPLCWLHAQRRRLVAHPADMSLGRVPTVYFADAEGNSESAAVGSCHTIHNLWDRMEDGSSHSKDERNDAWDAISAVPRGSRYYGGGRFDTSICADRRKDIGNEPLPGEEWKEFGNALWILPSVEIKRERLGVCTSSKKDENVNNLDTNRDGESRTVFAVHLRGDSLESFSSSAQRVLSLLQSIKDDASPDMPSATLPPIIRRELAYSSEDSRDAFEQAVCTALEELGHNTPSEIQGEEENSKDVSSGQLRKVVLARRAELHLGAGTSGLEILKKLRSGGHFGHLFYCSPGIGENEFFGCTPERLFKVEGDKGNVISEALAGTRQRGSCAEADAELLHDLMTSSKDREENIITGEYISNVLKQLREEGLLVNEEGRREKRKETSDSTKNRFFVRKLRHLQHICQCFQGQMEEGVASVDVARPLLSRLHPTPAVGGLPRTNAVQFIRRNEGCYFDRGYYAGPFGYISPDDTDIAVAIRSALLSRKSNKSIDAHGINNSDANTRLLVYAGAGIVPGSTAEGEWLETTHKLGAISSLFPTSPVTEPQDLEFNKPVSQQGNRALHIRRFSRPVFSTSKSRKKNEQGEKTACKTN